MFAAHNAPPAARHGLRRTLHETADAGIAALAVATALGLGLEAFRPGSALHPHFLASVGSSALDATLAAAFAALVLVPGPLRVLAPRSLRAASVVTGALVASLAAVGLSRHVAALAAGTVRAAGWAPPATVVALLLVVPWTVAAARERTRAPRATTGRVAGVLAAGTALVLALIASVGATDWRAPGDAILVLGSKVHPDGTPSGSLLDRTRTACALWKEGLAPRLVLSGGRDPGAVASEPEAMRRIALDEGVPEDALVLDETGVDTAASVRFTAKLARERGWSRVLVVSHDYHLARVRLLASREALVVRTVPARETCPSGWKGYAVVREVAAYLAAWAVTG